MIFYKRFPGDYGRDTQHLTTLEHGIYALLLDYLYSTEKPIQSFDDACRISKVHVNANKRACRRVLLHFFTEGPLGYTQKRVEEEISLAESKKGQCRRNADARWSQCKNDANGNASQTPDTRQPEKAKAIAAKPAAKRATPFFEGFSLDAEMIAFANERGVDPQEEFDKFRDHHKAKGSVFKDWPAAFRTWVRNAVKFDRGGKDVQRAGREVPKSFDQIRVEANQATFARILERNGISITRTQQPLRGTTRRDDAIDIPGETPRLTHSKD